MDKTVLVFGANGNLGSHFVNQTLEAGYKIKAFVRSPEKYALSENLNVEVVQGDATNYGDAGLTDKQGKGKYQIINKPTVFFPKFISRSDVAKFFVDCLINTSFDGKAVMIQGANLLCKFCL